MRGYRSNVALAITILKQRARVGTLSSTSARIGCGFTFRAYSSNQSAIASNWRQSVKTSASRSQGSLNIPLASILALLGLLSLQMADETATSHTAPQPSLTQSDAASAAEAKYNDPKLNKQEVLAFVESASAATPNDVELKWRKARALYDIAQEVGASQDTKKQKTYEAFEVIKEAFVGHPDHFAVQKWYGIILSEIGSFEGTKASIANAYVIRDAFTKATELNPKDATSRHLLGLWCFNIAGISWMTRQVASAIFGTPPSSSYQEALDNFLKAEALDPGFYKKNAFLITQCYAKLGKNDEAKVWLQKTLQIPTKTEEDKQVHAEAEKFGRSLR